MRLRKATILMLIGSIVALALILAAASELIIGSGFDELEVERDEQNLQRAVRLLHNEVDGIDTLVLDWSAWDAAYDFVSSHNQKFIDQNIIPATFEEQGLDFIGVFTLDGAPVYAVGVDPDTGELAPSPEGLLAKLEPGRILYPAEQDGELQPVKGLLLLEGGPFLVAVRPIVKSSGEGPAAGLLVMGKFVNQETAAGLEESLGLPLAVYRPDREMPSLAKALVQSPALTILDTTDHHAAKGYVEIKDLYGNPGLVIELLLDRDIHLQSHRTIRYFVITMVGAMLLFSALVLLFIETRVLSRMASLNRQVGKLSANPDLQTRIRLDSNDELTELAGGINSMLDKIAEARDSMYRELDARRSGELFLSQVFDAVKAGIMLVDPVEFTIQDVNSFALTLMGRTREEVVGKRCHGVVCPAEAGRCPVVDLGDRMDHSVRELIAAGGRTIPILKSVNRVQRNGKDLLLETFIDITDIRDAENALKLSEEMYRTVFRNTGAASIIVDMAGMITMANEQFEVLAGVKAEEVELRYFWMDFFPQETQRALLALQEVAQREGRAQHAMLTFRTVAGEERYVRALLAKLPGVNVCVVSLQDLTEQQQTEKALRTIQQELEETVSLRTKDLRDAVEELKEMDQLKSAFLSSASHELRTPLTSVLGYAKLLKRTLRRHFWPLAKHKEELEHIVQEVETNFTTIEREGRRLTQIIDDLLDLNNIESGSMAWRDEVFNPADVLDEAAKAITPGLAKKELVHLVSSYQRRLSPVRMDRLRLFQLLYNLLDNAVKFTHQGKIVLSAKEQVTGILEIRVEDSGMGIAKDEMESIFDKFYQTQSLDSLSEKPLGTGLGLTICRRIVERYGGRIWVESENGKGSTFIVRLPTVEAEKELRKLASE